MTSKVAELTFKILKKNPKILGHFDIFGYLVKKDHIDF